jgi:hypothetical protein
LRAISVPDDLLVDSLSLTLDIDLFNLALDSKLRSCDLVKLRVSDVSTAGAISRRAIVMQQKTSQPVQFEITK